MNYFLWGLEIEPNSDWLTENEIYGEGSKWLTGEAEELELNIHRKKNYTGLRVPWTARRSNQSILKEISPEYSLEGMMLNLKTPTIWPPDVKNWLIGKDPDAGKDWRQEEKETTENDMVGWHHRLNGHELE